MSYLILDIATTGLEGAEKYLDDEVILAPSNYKDAQKIAEYIAGKRQEKADRMALDLDLCRITAIGMMHGDDDDPGVLIYLNKTEHDESVALAFVRELLKKDRRRLLTFNGLRFDLPVLLRRCVYLGIEPPAISLDKYRTQDVDLWDRLTHHGAVGGHSLGFYVKRLGWTDLVKPLSGEEEARVPQTGRWDELRQSVRHDCVAIQRLAQWLQVVTVPLTVTEPIL